MKFITFHRGKQQSVGLWLDGDRVLDLGIAANMARESLDASTMLAIIRGGEPALDIVRRLAGESNRLATFPASEVNLLAPIPRPTKNIFCVGRNYLDHVKEGDRVRGVKTAEALPVYATFFSKPPTTVVGPGADVRYPVQVTKALDYEIELAVVIGKDGRDIPAARAFDYIFGYTILNDVTGRDLQRQHQQWDKGKSLDTSCPMGPWIVDKAEIGDPRSLELTFSLNGERRQNATVDTMIFDIPTIIAQLSAGMTLEAGDIIATGTPSGVGFAMTPPTVLKGGDEMVCEISRIGRLVNLVVEV
jgi:2-keto-4-pentenoate hydratase/2-oxohepta-3-ene-1,7-dioic acid hydratase in catechol pathway